MPQRGGAEPARPPLNPPRHCTQAFDGESGQAGHPQSTIAPGFAGIRSLVEQFDSALAKSGSSVRHGRSGAVAVSQTERGPSRSRSLAARWTCTTSRGGVDAQWPSKPGWGTTTHDQAKQHAAHRHEEFDAHQRQHHVSPSAVAGTLQTLVMI